jgi:predicted transcriptional regulator
VIDRGIPRREVRGLFGISRSAFKRWPKKRHAKGEVKFRAVSGRSARLVSNYGRDHYNFFLSSLQELYEACNRTTRLQVLG